MVAACRLDRTSPEGRRERPGERVAPRLATRLEVPRCGLKAWRKAAALRVVASTENEIWKTEWSTDRNRGTKFSGRQPTAGGVQRDAERWTPGDGALRRRVARGPEDLPRLRLCRPGQERRLLRLLWLRSDRSVLWLLPDLGPPALVARLLTLAESEAAGRVYAAYSGVYVVTALLWLWLVNGRRADRWDVAGTAVCLTGSMTILLAPRQT
ncbi:YnfA family protein [Falsiroseomonas ponticola]|uniref:YnfA family protein n=1 Tax=Falsiroseomonas ponticola TaxID=2786951 RepID=UPI001CF76EE4|nr:hypothetical protein [Roseomonas ponticola]